MIGGGVVGALLAPLGPVGIFIGGIIGSGLSSEAMRRLLNQFIEDDAVKLIEIVNSRLTILADEYLLSKSELDLVVEVLRGCLIYSKLLEMYASKDRIIFADELIEKCIQSVIVWRTRVRNPGQFIFTKGISRVLDKLDNNVFYISDSSQINAQDIATKILKRRTSAYSAQKALYVTNQFNNIGSEKERILNNIVDEEYRHKITMLELESRINEKKVRIQKMLFETRSLKNEK